MAREQYNQGDNQTELIRFKPPSNLRRNKIILKYFSSLFLCIFLCRCTPVVETGSPPRLRGGQQGRGTGVHVYGQQRLCPVRQRARARRHAHRIRRAGRRRATVTALSGLALVEQQPSHQFLSSGMSNSPLPVNISY